MRRGLALLVVLGCCGCAGRHRSVADAFPPGSVAAPWILQDQVWVGSFEEAATSLGEDGETWRRFGPTRVWLAVYRHDSDPERWIKVRCLAFESVEKARQAFQAFRPAGAEPYDLGQVGCWTEIGVLFQWERLVFDIFGDRAGWGSQVQSSYIAALIGKRMPAGVPGDPQ